MLALLDAAALGDRVGTVHYVDPQNLAPPSRSVRLRPRLVRPPGEAFLRVPEGLKTARLAEGLSGPRNIAVAPNGDVFVVEARARGVVVLRDGDADGRAEIRGVFCRGLDGPHGIAFYRSWLYVANTDAIWRFRYRPGQLSAEGAPQKIASLPAKPGPNLYWTRTLAFSPDGSRLYVSVGSATNKSVEPLPRGAILSMSPEGEDRKVVASGLRNAAGLAYRQATGELWASCIERDYMGNDCPPDFLTRVEEGQFFGWPWFYIGKNPDPAHAGKSPPRTDVAVPDILVEAHSIPLEICFYEPDSRATPKAHSALPKLYAGSLFAAQRGSTNRVPQSGYKVVRFPIVDGRVSPRYEDFVVGWNPDRNKPEVYGRPVAVAVARDGALLIGDEPGRTIWRVRSR
jgi:glucose/arabinose dehydrogenase